MSTTASSAIILIAHGARDPDWRQPFEAIKARIEQRLPGARVALAFLEFMAPPLDAAVDALVDEGAQRIVVIPVFMAQGGHVKRDVPLILDALRARRCSGHASALSSRYNRLSSASCRYSWSTGAVAC